MKPLIHAVAGSLAILCILSFWVSTAISELFLSPDVVAAVKEAILYGMWLLVPAIAITGASGFSLGNGRTSHSLARKKMRMRLIAMNGLLIMLPSAFFLSHKATAGEFDSAFYVVQLIELVVGAVQLSLMTLNFRDGLRLAGRLRIAHQH